MPELGATGRGEYMEIGTFIEKSISSELSGNVIDICPVGALTAKPSRYTARPWELTQHAAVSWHDCVGSNTYVHTRGSEVIRVVPRENESINETWISDRDRFSYVALKSAKRITQPMMRENGELVAVDWETALNAAAQKISAAGTDIAALMSPQATLEEHYLAQKLLRGLGSNNIDHRLDQVDFSAQEAAAVMPWLGRSLQSLESLDSALIVAANLRYQQPMISHRLRKAVINNGASVSSIGHIGGQYNFKLHRELNGSAEQLVHDLAALVAALAESSGSKLSPRLTKMLKTVSVEADHRAIAKSLQLANTAVIVGLEALSSPYLSLIQELCETITSLSESTLGYLSTSANSAGACLAGATPHRAAAAIASESIGENAQQILSAKHRLLISFALNPTLDLRGGDSLRDNNETIIAISCFDNEFLREQADLVLPLASLIESSGSFVNVEGLWQSFKGCLKASGDSRQGWKILAALGQVLVPGQFDYADSMAVRDELKALCHDVSLSNLCGLQSERSELPKLATSLQKISLIPLYASDEMTRQSAPLQATPISKAQNALLLNEKQAKKSKLLGCEQVHVKQGHATAVLPLRIDDGIPDGCVYIPGGIDAVKHLGVAFAHVELEKLS